MKSAPVGLCKGTAFGHQNPNDYQAFASKQPFGVSWQTACEKRSSFRTFDDYMDHAKTIALYQPLLHRIAYNLVRCKEDAEDIVQETFEKWLSLETEIKNTRAYLIRSVRNNCLNHLASLKRKKEEYMDSLDASPFLNKVKENNFSHLDLEIELQNAFRIMQTKLEPMERAVYLLREAFDFDYDALQETLNKKKDHLRQLFCRAKKKLEEETSQLHFDLPAARKMMENFREACTVDNASAFIQHLRQDIGEAIQNGSKRLN